MNNDHYCIDEKEKEFKQGASKILAQHDQDYLFSDSESAIISILKKIATDGLRKLQIPELETLIDCLTASNKKRLDLLTQDYNLNYVIFLLIKLKNDHLYQDENENEIIKGAAEILARHWKSDKDIYFFEKYEPFLVKNEIVSILQKITRGGMRRLQSSELKNLLDYMSERDNHVRMFPLILHENKTYITHLNKELPLAEDVERRILMIDLQEKQCLSPSRSAL